ncbi:hypothetical protein JCM12141A_27140 [Mycolicibacterium hodleri]
MLEQLLGIREAPKLRPLAKQVIGNDETEWDVIQFDGSEALLLGRSELDGQIDTVSDQIGIIAIHREVELDIGPLRTEVRHPGTKLVGADVRRDRYRQ